MADIIEVEVRPRSAPPEPRDRAPARARFVFRAHFIFRSPRPTQPPQAKDGGDKENDPVKELPDAEDESVALVDTKVLEEEEKLREERKKAEMEKAETVRERATPDRGVPRSFFHRPRVPRRPPRQARAVPSFGTERRRARPVPRVRAREPARPTISHAPDPRSRAPPALGRRAAPSRGAAPRSPSPCQDPARARERDSWLAVRIFPSLVEKARRGGAFFRFSARARLTTQRLRVRGRAQHAAQPPTSLFLL